MLIDFFIFLSVYSVFVFGLMHIGSFFTFLHSYDVAPVLCFVFGGAILVLLLLLGLSFGVRGELLASFLFLLMLPLIMRKPEFKILSGSEFYLAAWLMYVVITCVVVLPADLSISNFSLKSVQELFGLPVDNILQYQTVRYVTENINPSSLQPVPNWNFGDRGPFAGLLVSAFFLIFGVSESAQWLSGLAYPAFLYQVLMVTLNSLPILLIPLLLKRHGKIFSMLGLALYIFNPFFFINSAFTWPKIFAASLFVLGAFLFLNTTSSRKDKLIALLPLGLSLIVHEGTYVYSVPFAFYVLIFRRDLLRLDYIVLGLMPLIVWTLYKNLHSLQSSGLLVYNALCLSPELASSKGFFQLASELLAEKGVWTLVSVRFGNFWYPIDIFHFPWSSVIASKDIIQFFRLSANLVFYQFLFAACPFLLLVLIYGFFSQRAFEIKMCIVMSFTLLVVGCLQGCELSSWNHIWSYGLLLTLFIALPLILLRMSKLVSFVVLLYYFVSSAIYIGIYTWFPLRSAERFEVNSSREVLLYILFACIAALGIHMLVQLVSREEEAVN